MISTIIATHESERALVQTLSPLVAGATAGLIAEVIVADGGSRDATAEVADLAGCRFLQREGPVGTRLREAAALARTPWLLFLRPGTVPEPAWLDAVDAFMQGEGDAAQFRGAENDLLAKLLPFRSHPDRGLLVRKRAYEAAGGHAPSENAEAALLRRLRVARLTASARLLDFVN